MINIVLHAYNLRLFAYFDLVQCLTPDYSLDKPQRMDHINDRKDSADYSKATSNAEAAAEHASAQLQPPAFQLMAKESPVQESEESTTQEKTTQLLTANGEGPSQPNDNNEKPNNTGLPTQLKSGIENLSGFSLDDVKVHRNSDKPAQLHAHAYAQGTDIHLGPGQERHLPHEAWHVVQQKEGRVKPTMQMKAFNINDDVGLEKEADVMGAKAAKVKKENNRAQDNKLIKNAQNDVYQRILIPAASVQGMTGDLDTSDYTNSKLLIDQLFNRGNRKVIRSLYVEILKGKNNDPTPNDQSLLNYIDELLTKSSRSDPESAKSGFFATKSIDWSQSAPTHPDPNVQAGLRLWIAGDPAIPGLGWKPIGLFLQGRLPDDDIIGLGDTYYTFKPDPSVILNNNTKKVKGTSLLNKAIADLRGALDALPAFDGKTYRQAGVLDSTVYGGKIQLNDYIKDKGFWSTSALKKDGSAGTWGSDGTTSDPKVYFIITGSSGKYINKYANLEHGQHEVLFKDSTIFQVTKIANYKEETFFVHLTEIDPATLPGGTPIKNSYSGDVYA